MLESMNGVSEDVFDYLLLYCMYCLPSSYEDIISRLYSFCSGSIYASESGDLLLRSVMLLVERFIGDFIDLSAAAAVGLTSVDCDVNLLLLLLLLVGL